MSARRLPISIAGDDEYWPGPTWDPIIYAGKFPATGGYSGDVYIYDSRYYYHDGHDWVLFTAGIWDLWDEIFEVTGPLPDAEQEAVLVETAIELKPFTMNKVRGRERRA